MKEFGFKKPNVDFVHGYIEALTDAGLAKNSYDIIMQVLLHRPCFCVVGQVVLKL